MKNKSALVFILMTMILGCSERRTTPIEQASDLGGKVVGMNSPAASTQNMEAIISKAMGAAPKEVIFFDRYVDSVAAAIAGKIDAVFAPRFIADYHLKRNAVLKLIEPKDKRKINIIMAVRSEDRAFKDDLDKAIASFQDNGLLKRLEQDWIVNLPADREPERREIVKRGGAKTVYVGVCADFTPLDYISADGRPAGYNVALLNEIGNFLNLNFEFVSIEAKARFVALASKKIDLIFCHIDANTPATEGLKNESWIGTKPYYTSESGCFLVRK